VLPNCHPEPLAFSPREGGGRDLLFDAFWFRLTMMLRSHGGPTVLTTRAGDGLFMTSPQSFPRWSAAYFLFEKKVGKENTHVQFKSAN
jgi:hypothetical protein